jgi:serine/threonine protein kinase
MTISAMNVGPALSKAIGQTMESMAFMTPEPCSMETCSLPANGSTWSWIKLVEPWQGTFVLAMAPELSKELAMAVMGQLAPPNDSEIADTQAELTNVAAGTFLHELLGEKVGIGLGLPRTGRGAPNVREPGWISQGFALGGRYLIAYVQGSGIATVPVVKRDTAAEVTVVTSSFGSDTEQGSSSGSIAHEKSIGGFTIIDLLGEGGMGVVYRAHHATLNRTVALKVMRAEFARNDMFAARFLREARAAAMIDHPNVVTVYDAGKEDDQLYIAMRFVTGGDLAGLIQRTPHFSEEKALMLIAQCLLGLEAINSHGMVHRDIKPANILLESDGSPRIADLGLARSVATDDGLSIAGGTQGTPSYMSPEQARGVKQIDIRTDIYSFGTTLYAMLGNGPPFSGTTAYEIVSKVLTESPEPLIARNPRVSPDVAVLVAKAMAKNPDERFQTPGEFVEAIESVLSGSGKKNLQTISGRFRPFINVSLPDASDSGVRKAIDPPSTTSWMDKLFRRGEKRRDD